MKKIRVYLRQFCKPIRTMTKSRIQVVFDAGPLITACKFEAGGKLVVDHLLSGCYRVGVIEHSLERLKEVKVNA